MDDGDFFINISGLGSTSSLPKTASAIETKGDAAAARRTRPPKGSGKGKASSSQQGPISSHPSGKRKHQNSTFKSDALEKPTKKARLAKHSSKSVHIDSAVSNLESKRDGQKGTGQLSTSTGTHTGKTGKMNRKKVKHATDRAFSPVSTPEIAEGQKEQKTKRKVKQSSMGVGTGGGLQMGMNLSDLTLHESLKRQLEFLQFKQCTPIQALAIPAALDGRRDVLIRASTGSGKTLAFLLPVLHQLLSLSSDQRERKSGTLALILSPTKELALQTLKVAQDLLRMVPSVVCGSVAGGEKPKSEKARLRKGLAVLCATPGRLAYHLEHTATFVIANLRYLVLDEADRLLDLGFEPQIRRIYKMIKEAHENHVMAQEAIGREVPKFVLRSLLVSATLSPAVRHLANFCLRKDAFWADPDAGADGQETETSKKGITFSVPETLTQWYCLVPCKERLVALISSIMSRTSAATSPQSMLKAIVFFATNASVDFHHDIFKDIDWPSIAGFSKNPSSNTPLLKKRKDGFIGFAETQEEDEEEDGDEDDEEEEDEEEDDEEEGQASKDDGKNNAKRKRPKIFVDVPLFKLHGNLDKEERAGYIQDFSRARGGVLLSSDAASRGLDFPQIDWIIQFDPPQSIEEYLHRIGRTARIGRRGNALLFLQPHERGFLDVLRSHGVNNLKEIDPETLPLELLRCGAPEDLLSTYNFGQLFAGHLSSHVAACAPLLKLARSAFLSALRSYRAFPRELRSAFPFHELHTGHFASSFALRETPEEASRLQRRSFGGKHKDAKGKGKSKGGGKGKDSTDASKKQPRQRMKRLAGAMDEFS